MNLLIVIISIVFLIVLHELGHFIFAKKYGVRVDEFGVGIPPRLWGKKIGETIYSINWIPLGGFVKLYGEDKNEKGERSFSQKPIYQRAVILFAGVAAFFITSAVLFSVIFLFGGVNMIVDDNAEGNAFIVVLDVQEGSSAEVGGLLRGDRLVEVNGERVSKVRDLQEKVSSSEEVNLLVLREKEVVFLSLGSCSCIDSCGMNILRMIPQETPFYMAPVKGTVMMFNMTGAVVHGFYTVISSFAMGKELPPGMELGGPVKIVQIGSESLDRGFLDYIYFIGVISVSLAVLNILPIPALDGGRLFFLGIEKIKGSPIPEKVEQVLNATFFIALITLMLFITFKDIQGL